MKLTSLTLGGFKGIRNTAHIPLAPITLLFGANSTGKSSILHGLLYLYEILVNQNIDAEYSELTGKKVWLGGFRNMVFGKGTGGVITLGATLDFSESEEVLDDYLSSAEHYFLESTIACFPDAEAKSWSFKLEIAWDEDFTGKPFIRQFECFGDDELFCRFEKKAGTPGSYITYYKPLSTWNIPDEIGVLADVVTSDYWQVIGLSDQKQALPDINRRINLVDTTLDAELQEETFHQAIRTFAEASLSQAALAPLKILGKKLKTLLHVGPLRVVPDQQFYVSREHDSSRWFDGRGAWDLFVNGSKELRSTVNRWFLTDDGFGTSYQFVDSQPNSLGQKTVYVDNLNSSIRHALSELGVGVSQVFPFVVGVCSDYSGILSCEQPELHIHPRWQLVLADMMLEHIKGEADKMFLVETHSEHLMLRLLRRRRETADEELECPEYSCKQGDVQIVFCEQKDGETSLRFIHTTDDGEFDASWPNGFFAERRGEL
ncbi:hypothetical protein [Endozoicomonas sp. ALB115]|uniref:hypothetical protein n=1 Tax=Endozoicomonas sp. ALB115 TaxID=3403074 RepID=UPI003BB5F92D